ncbi:hypothetical protein RB195_009860 [Necator americanus]|uniref:Protein kinase domain-containing protein n=1 Tax=Necator americanus TaxID=51031 RepID=A0ABR1CVA3_NECAM
MGSKSEDHNKKETVNKQEVESLTNMLFLRKNTEKLSPYEKMNRKGPKKVNNFCEAHLVGTVSEGPPSATVCWRIMGMRMRRSEGASTDYDVHRMPSDREVGGSTISERIPMERREGILRLCRYDSESGAMVFKHELLLLKMLAKTYTTRSHRAHFPWILGQGSLAELRYLNVLETSTKQRDIVETPKIPRLYFITESLEPSVETILKSNKTPFLPVYTSVYIIIGCIKALRLLHMQGFAHRNVQPAYFSLRLPCGGLLSRKESEIADLVAITELSSCKKYRVNLTRGRNCPSYVGNWKYGSTETMTGKDPTATDDIISCIYMLTEFVLGSIPWATETEKQAIISHKKQVERWDRVEDEKHNVLLINYHKLYEWLRKQPPLETIDYEAFYEELLKTPETGNQAGGDQSLFGFSNPLNDVYEHGFAEKKGGRKRGSSGAGSKDEESGKESKRKESESKETGESKGKTATEPKSKEKDGTLDTKRKEAQAKEGEKVSDKRSTVSSASPGKDTPKNKEKERKSSSASN